MNNYKSRNDLRTKTCLGRCGYNWVRERVHIGYPSSGDTGQHGAVTWQERPQTEGNGRQPGRQEPFSVTE
jgi:hypothetical protein